VFSACGLVDFRAVCLGNCSRMLWIELAVCHVLITTVCIATDREITSTIRMSAKIDHQVRQVHLSVFLFAWKNWVTDGRNFVKWYIYIYVIYEEFSKFYQKFKRDWIMRRKRAIYMEMCCKIGAVMVISDWIVIRINSDWDNICRGIRITLLYSIYSQNFCLTWDNVQKRW